MSFASKKDYFGLADDTYLKISDSTEGKSAQTVTAQNDKGDVVSREVFGINYSPSCSYKVLKCFDASSSTTISVTIGGTTTTTSEIDSTSFYACLGNVSISTSAGGEPTVSASGESVHVGTGTPNSCAIPCTYTVEIDNLSPKRHAQLLSFGGYGCPITQTSQAGELIEDGWLTGASYEIGANIGKSTVNGDTVAADVDGGHITATLTIVGTRISSGSVETPVVTANTTNGWAITSPLTITNSDSQYPQYTCTITLDLSKDEEESSDD